MGEMKTIFRPWGLTAKPSAIFSATFLDLMSCSLALVDRGDHISSPRGLSSPFFSTFTRGLWIIKLSAHFLASLQRHSRILRNAELALEKCLRRILEASISWPNFIKQQEWAEKVQKKEPQLKGIWGFVDWKRYNVQVPTTSELQNVARNGRFWMIETSNISFIYILFFL